MPGVPTSKGCEACRRRKKGCDLGRPSCGRCFKLGIKCVNSGTGRLIFVDENGQLAQRHATSTPSQHSSRRLSPAVRNSSFPSNEGSASQLARLNKSAIVDHATGILWLAYAPVEASNASCSQIWGATWLSVALQLSHQDRTLDDAISALALSRMSRATGDIRARKEALMFYGSCIRNIRKSILDPARLRDDSLLASIILLTTFELHEGTYKRDSAWAAHVDGASRLINARGPSSLRKGAGREFYLSHLRAELMYCISKRGPPSKNMTQALRAIEGLDDTPELQLLRIMNRLPTIMHHADGLRHNATPTVVAQGWASLLNTCRETLLALEKFSDDLTILSYPAALYTKLPSQLFASLPSNSPERIFPEYLHFSTLFLGSLQITAWTSILLIHSIVLLTFGRLSKFSQHFNLPPPEMPKHSTTYTQTLALDISKSLEFFILPENGLLGAQNVGFAIPIVMGYMTFLGQPEQLWFTVLFRRMRELNLGVEGFLTDMFRGQELRLIRPLDVDETTQGEKTQGEAELRTRDVRFGGNVFGIATYQYKSEEEVGV